MRPFGIRHAIAAAAATVAASLALSPALGLGQSQAATIASPTPLAAIAPDGSRVLASAIANSDAGTTRSARVALPTDGSPTLQVRDGKQVDLHSSPGGNVVDTVSDATEFGSPVVLSVIKRKGNWAGVPTQLLPNGQLAWVKLNEKQLKIDTVHQEIRIDLSDYSAALLRNGKVERTWEVGIGAPDTPTPTGHFSITDKITDDLNPAYGCCVLALSATQPNLPAGWTGGNRMALHGTSEPLGEANSTGCVHNGESDLLALMERAPLGTPVTISR
jgi:lipoprotein-anchoring transpeptidase ErfK/SrfK